MITRTDRTASRYCKNCENYVLAYYDQPNWLIHASLIIFTCFLYTPIALVVWLLADDYVCSRCGRGV